MYLRAAHAELSIPALRTFIHSNPLGVLTTAFPSPNYPTIQCTHIPFLLDIADPSSVSELGVLRSHMARANPHAKSLIEHFSSSSSRPETTPYELQEEVMILFTHPSASHYVTPQFYTTTKPATGKVVPTWNYAAAQAYGRARFYLDAHSPETVAFLSKQITDLSTHAEGNHTGFEKTWKVSDAPEKFIELLRKSIVGIEVTVTRLEGKFKMSQELADEDREGVISGFREAGNEEMAEMVRWRGELKAEEKARKP